MSGVRVEEAVSDADAPHGNALVLDPTTARSR